MRISLLILPSLVLAAAATSSNKTEYSTKTTKRETRDKRTVDQFGRSLNTQFSSNFNYKYGSPSISKRISNAPKYENLYFSTNTYQSSPFAQNDFNYNVIKDFDSQGSNYIHEPHYASQYIEAPEPIIEIIIKESNESLPITPQPYVQHKKPKEQVQVFYVKYKKDNHEGLVIDDPIPALSPEAYQQDSNRDDDVQGDIYPVTQKTPFKTTTLRTIIHPDSEKFHSNSGIVVTFNSEEKHKQTDNSYQEHYEGSEIQQVVASSDPRHYRQQFFNQNSQIQQKQLKTVNPNNYIDSAGQNNFNENPLPYHLSYQQLPRQQGPTQIFRENHDHFHRRQPQSPTQQHPPHLQPPPQQPAPQQQPPQHHAYHPQFQQDFTSGSFEKQHFFEGQTYRFQSQPNQHPQQYKKVPHPSRPKPIPIPLHNEEQQSYTQLTRPPQIPTQYTSQNEEQFVHNRLPLNLPQQNSRPLPQFQQPFNYFQDYNRNTNTYDQNVQGGDLVQKNPPYLSIQNTEHQRPYLQNSNYNLPNQIPNLPSQIFNSDQRQSYRQPEVVTGAELVQSVPKYEQHITETITSSSNNQAYRPLIQNPSQQIQTQYRDTNTEQQYEQNLFNNSQSQQMQIVLPTNYQSTNGNAYNSDTHTVQDYIARLPESHQSEQESPESKSQYSPLVRPITQKLRPGQSVSTLADEVFPSLVAQQSQNEQSSSNEQQISGRNKISIQKTVSVTQKPVWTTTHKTSTTEKPEPTTTSKSSKKAQLELPSEVPDELRQSLISSGILDNADISVLDYDKIGDVPIESLPPEHLANFYGAGGVSQISSSNKVVTVVKPNGEQVHEKEVKTKIDNEQKISAKLSNVDLKVVRFDSNNQRAVTDKYIKNNSTILPSVDIGEQYNRYLPLKVNGAQFPIPNVEELRGKTISSVVVLAPVDNLQSIDDRLEGRYERDVLDSKQIKFVAGDSLKQLIKKPTKENFKKWLEKESKTDIDMQSVVLLVTKDINNDKKEIYMYDIALQRVNKLSGELSSAFVNVAEENANAQDMDNASLSDSGIVEQMTTKIKRSDENIGGENFDDEIDHESQQPSESVSTYVKPNNVDGKGNVNQIVINSGYSVITH